MHKDRPPLGRGRLQHTGTSELIVDGRKLRYSYTAEPEAVGRGVRANTIHAFNGEVERSHYDGPQPANQDFSREYYANRSFAACLAVTSLPRTLYSTFDPVLRISIG